MNCAFSGWMDQVDANYFDSNQLIGQLKGLNNSVLKFLGFSHGILHPTWYAHFSHYRLARAY